MDLVPVTHALVEPLMDLSLAPGQEGLVARNAESLAQAAYEPGAHAWALVESAAPVGLMTMIDLAQDPDATPQERDAAYLWRLMVDANHQGKGFGQHAVTAAFAQARAWGRTALLVHVAQGPGNALAFYKRFGFVETGRIEHGEKLLRAPL